MSNLFENNLTPELEKEVKLVNLSNEVEKLELQLANYKQIEEKHKQLKTQLYNAMVEYDVKSWETDNIKITRVNGVEEKVVKESGRSGYVKISVKENKNADV